MGEAGTSLVAHQTLGSAYSRSGPYRRLSIASASSLRAAYWGQILSARLACQCLQISCSETPRLDCLVSCRGFSFPWWRKHISSTLVGLSGSVW